MLVTTNACDLDLSHGPGWLFLRLRNFDPDSPEADSLADRIWSLLDNHLVYRVVLEMDEVELLRSILIAQLIMLQRRVNAHQGMVHLAGLSPHNREVLATCRLDDRLPAFQNRIEAVMGVDVAKPR